MLLKALLLISIMIAPMAQEFQSMTPAAKPTGSQIRHPAMSGQKPLMLAENGEGNAEDKTQTKTTAQNRAKEPGSGSQTGQNETSAGSKTVPLKDFKPSEEIAAEQAVDFPVDI